VKIESVKFYLMVGQQKILKTSALGDRGVCYICTLQERRMSRNM